MNKCEKILKSTRSGAFGMPWPLVRGGRIKRKRTMASLASVHPQSCPYTPLSNRRGFVESGHQIEKLEFALAVAIGRGDQQRIHELRQRIADLGDNREEPGT